MSSDLFKRAAKYGLTAAFPAASLANLITDVAVSSVTKSKEVAKEGDLDNL